MNANLHKWENPLFFKENKLDGHNLALPLDLKDKVAYNESKYKLSLNGIWKFYWRLVSLFRQYSKRALSYGRISCLPFIVR